MAKNYEVVAIQDEEGYFWGITEKKTEQLIETFYFLEDAQDYQQFLERGGAFDGFTPAFILNSFTIPESLDESFQREFDVA